MVELSIRNIAKNYIGEHILVDVSFDIKYGERVGLIGRNGCGKTTLFKMITGQESIDGGSLYFRKGSSLGYLDQIPDFDDTTFVEDILDKALEKVKNIYKEMQILEQKLQDIHHKDYDFTLKQFGEKQEQFDLLGGYEMNVQKDKVCSGLKISNALRQQYFHTLSGGERTMIMLAKLLLESPSILLLDEPTNHLDIEAVVWLEDFLKEYKGAVLIISHDRIFLDRAVTKIVEIEFGKSETYAGKYSFYRQEKELKIRQEFEAYKSRQKKIKALREAAERYRVWGRINTDNNAHMARAKKYEAMAEELEAIGRPKQKQDIQLNLHQGKRSGKDAIILQDCSKRFSNRTILDQANLLIQYQEKAALLGANGSGKSTIIKMLIGEVSPDSGSCKTSESALIGYLEQEVQFENEDMCVLDAFQKKFMINVGPARSLLAKALFVREDVFKKISDLSGGERVRLKLAYMMQNQVNLLLLDEPTNHLDIYSREQLEDALENFDGTILMVSHDRYFIGKIANKILYIQNKKIKTYIGSYHEYLASKDKENQNLNHKVDNKTKTFDKSKSQKNTKKISKNKINQLQNKIDDVELRLTSIEKEMDFNAQNYEKLMELMNNKNDLEQKLEILYEQWYEIQE